MYASYLVMFCITKGRRVHSCWFLVLELSVYFTFCYLVVIRKSPVEMLSWLVHSMLFSFVTCWSTTSLYLLKCGNVCYRVCDICMCSDLLPHCLEILKTAHHLTDKLVSVTLTNARQLQFPETLTDLVATARRIGTRVDDVVRALYPPLDARLLEARWSAQLLTHCLTRLYHENFFCRQICSIF